MPSTPALPLGQQALAYYRVCREAMASPAESFDDTVRVFGDAAYPLAYTLYQHEEVTFALQPNPRLP